MKKTTLLIALALLIFVSIGAIYVLNNPSCCKANNVNVQNNLSENLSPQDFKNAIESGKYKLIDIRTIAEYNTGHIQGATEQDFYQTKDFNNFLDSLDKNGKYLIYCHTGNRSGQALQMAKDKGFTNIHDLTGGINNWIANGYSTVK